jgi:hypothetical protein
MAKAHPLPQNDPIQIHHMQQEAWRGAFEHMIGITHKQQGGVQWDDETIPRSFTLGACQGF